MLGKKGNKKANGAIIQINKMRKRPRSPWGTREGFGRERGRRPSKRHYRKGCRRRGEDSSIESEMDGTRLVISQRYSCFSLGERDA